MSTGFDALAATLGDIAANRPKGQGGKFAPKQKRLMRPQTYVKYSNSGSFEFKAENARGTLVDKKTPQLKGVIMDANFEWAQTKDVTKNGKKSFETVCATTSHVDGKDSDGNAVVGNGRWKIPFFQHDEVLKRYQPKGMRLREPNEGEDGKQVMSCAECHGCGLNLKNEAEGIGKCGDKGSIIFVAFEYFDAENEEWKAFPKPLLMDIKATRGSNDVYQRYLGTIVLKHKRELASVVTTLRTKGPDGIGKYNLVFEEDLDESDWVETAAKIFKDANEKHAADIAAYVAQKNAERDAAKGDDAPAPKAQNKAADTPKKGKPAPVNDDSDIPF